MRAIVVGPIGVRSYTHYMQHHVQLWVRSYFCVYVDVKVWNNDSIVKGIPGALSRSLLGAFPLPNQHEAAFRMKQRLR